MFFLPQKKSTSEYWPAGASVFLLKLRQAVPGQPLQRRCMGAAGSSTYPCQELLDSYCKCMDEHEGVPPKEYEPEFCEVEKNAYRACRATLKAQKAKGAETNEEK